MKNVNGGGTELGERSSTDERVERQRCGERGGRRPAAGAGTGRRSIPVLIEDHIEPLVRRTLAGEQGAWRELWRALDPTIDAFAARYGALGRVAVRDDTRRDIVVGVMGSLRADGFSRLKRFREALLRRDGSARGLLALTTRRTALNHARAHAENLRGRGDNERGWAQLLPLQEELADALPISIRAPQAMDVLTMNAYARTNLPATTYDALRLWLVGESFTEIAAALGLGEPEDAQLLVRAAVNHLRRRFAGRKS